MRVNGNRGLYMVYIWTIMIYIWFIMVYVYIYVYCLVVSTYPSEKYDFVSWDDDNPNVYGKTSKIPWFQSPPTRTY